MKEAATLPRTREAPRWLVLDWSLLAPVGVFVTVIALAAPNGSYFPSSWGWAALAFLWAAVVGLLLGRSTTLSALETGYLASFTLLLGWVAASTLWTPTLTQTMYEIERTIVYVAFAFAFALLARKHAQWILTALMAGIDVIAAYALATRLFPDRVGSFDSVSVYRLSAPLGYWNALGVFAVVGILVAVGLAARARQIIVRSLSAASLVLLVPVLYFTFSRGAWVGLAAGLAVAIAVDPRRLQLVTTMFVVAPWPALAVWRAYESPGLTTSYSPLSAASVEGRRLAFEFLVLALAAAVVTAAFALVSARITVAPLVRWLYGGLLALTLIGLVVSVVARYGGPVESARRAVDSIRVSSPNVHGNQTQRLFRLSSNGRLNMWDAALQDRRAHPLLGSGAGTYQRWWARHRDIPLKVRDAHSLYVETLAELGPIGLALLLCVVGIPFVAGIRARSHPFAPPALAGFTAVAVHAGLDWDWEIPAVIVSGLTCAGTLLLLQRERAQRRWALGGVSRAVCLAVIIAASALSFVTLTGNRALAQSDGALNRSDLGPAVSAARRAQRWEPWSTDALAAEGDAVVVNGSQSRAAQLYREALAKDDGNWELWFDLALATNGTAQRKALARAAALNPRESSIQEVLQAVRTTPARR